MVAASPTHPDWVFDYYEHYNSPAGVGRPLCNEEWHQRAFREDQQAAGLLPPAPWGGPILHGARARAECAYKDWKWAINDLWADEHHHQQLLEEQAARACQEAAAARAHQEAAAACARQEAAAARARQEAAAARACHEAARRQQLLDEQATRARPEAGLLFAKHLFARCVAEDQRSAERRAQARERAAARTIILWLCRRRLHIRLIHQTLRRQQREAALARLRYEQDCCRRAALAEEQHRQAAAARAKAAIDEATEQLCRVEDALSSAWAIALAVVDNKHHRHEAAAHATALAAKVLADERGGQESAVRAKVFAAQALAITPSNLSKYSDPEYFDNRVATPSNLSKYSDPEYFDNLAAARDKALADEANERCRHELAKRATTSATKPEHNEDDDDVARQIEAYAAPSFARLDVVMAEIRAMDDNFGNWAAFGDEILAEEDNKVSDLMMPPSAPPTAVSPTPHQPTTYKDAVLCTMGGDLRVKSLVVAPFSRPSTTVDDQPQTACRRSQPRRRVGRRHDPQAPNPQEHLLRGQQHWPRAPNQSTENGWA
jgi:hypothetical protein